MDNDDSPLCGPPFEGVAVQLVPEWRAFRRGGDGTDCDGLPPGWVEGVTLDYYPNKGGLLLGPFDAPPVRP